MLSLKVDSETKNIKIELMLKGEADKLDIEIKEYKNMMRFLFKLLN